MANVGYATLQIIPSVRGIGNELRSQLVGPAGSAGTDAGESAGGGFREAFEGALAALGVEALAEKAGDLFSEAFNSAIEQSNVTSTLQAQLGASNADASKYGAEVGKLYAQGVTSEFEQGAEVIRSIVNGHLVDPKATAAQLDVVAKQMADVSNTFETDLNRQAEAVSAILKNKLAPNASAALDIITTGFQKLGPNADDLLDTFQEYPVQLRKLGLDGKTALGLFSQGIKAGARDTDIIADAFKEFSIRAVDGSTGTAAGFKTLGISASGIATTIGKGGRYARDALSLVLDKLRQVPDPVKRGQAAVALFGTQAEDLGNSLFALDPKKATQAFGDIAGSADNLGKTLRSGPSYEITLFKRTVQQGLVTFIGGQVLPLLGKWGATFDEKVLPPLAAVGGVLSDDFLPALHGTASVIGGVVDWFRKWGIWLLPLGVLVGGLALALSAQAIATGISTAATAIYVGVIDGAIFITEGWAGAIALLDAVMDANPIALVVIAVAALAALFFVAWKRSDTFRAIVMGAWQGIQTAAMVAWTTVLKPTIDGLVIGWQAVATGAMWLWTNVLSPVFSFISTAAKILATVIGVVLYIAFSVWWAAVKLYAGLVMVGLRAVAAVGMWLWTNVFSPVVGWLIAGFGLWWTGVKLYAGLVMTGLRAVAGVGIWLWRSILSPVIGWIVGGFRLWWSGVQLYAGLVKTALHAVGDAASWLYHTAISPAFHGIATAASWVYDKGIKPPLDKAKQLASEFGTAFKTAAATIGTELHKIEDFAKKPINFVINTVYNKGLVGVWNKVAGAFGAPKLGKFPGLKRGGPVFGAGTETSDDVPAWLSRNEHVWTAREVRGAGGHGAVAAMRAWAARGGGSGAPGFKGGGAFGWIGSAANAVAGAGSAAWNGVKKGASWLKDSLAASARAGVRAVVNPLLNQIPGLDTGWGKMIKAVPDHMINALFGFSDDADKKGASTTTATGPGALGQWIAKAISLAGVPLDWAGPLRTLVMRESGGNPKAVNLNDSNAAAGDPSRGLAQTIGATFEHYRLTSLPDDIYNPIANLVAALRYIKAVYGSIFKVQQADSSKAPKGYASGGSPRPGEIAWVGEHGPELLQFSGGEVIYSNAQSRKMAAAGLRGFAKGTVRGSFVDVGARNARGQVPGDITGFTKSLTGSASAIAASARELAKDLLAAGGAGRGLSVSASRISATLQSLAGKRDALAGRIATARQAATDQSKTATDFLGLGNLGDATSATALIAGLRGRQKTARNFQSSIASLSKRGLSQDLISQLVAMGPDSALAGVVAQAGPGQIKQLNALAKSGSKLAVSYGNTMADAMFDSGKDASKGFLAGLVSQEKALQAEMTKLGSGLVASIRDSLDSHSPSRVTFAVGQDTGAGLVLGLDASTAHVRAAGARLGSAAIPTSLAARVAAAAAGSGAAAMAPGGAYRRDDGGPLRVEVIAKDRVLNDLIDVRVYKATGELVQALDAGGGN